jgi:hypothetical protein
MNCCLCQVYCWPDIYCLKTQLASRHLGIFHYIAYSCQLPAASCSWLLLLDQESLCQQLPAAALKSRYFLPSCCSSFTPLDLANFRQLLHFPFTLVLPTAISFAKKIFLQMLPSSASCFQLSLFLLLYICNSCQLVKAVVSSFWTLLTVASCCLLLPLDPATSAKRYNLSQHLP